jgi:hypothetical protein
MPTDLTALAPTDARLVADDPARLDWNRPGLSARSRRIMLAAAEAMYSDEDARGRVTVAGSVVCERAVDGLDRLVGSASEVIRHGFAVFTFVMQVLPLFVIGRFARMTDLPLDERVRYLESLEHSRLGFIAMLFVAVKVPMTICAFEEGDELGSTGFDRPDTVARRKRPPRRAEPKVEPKAETTTPAERAEEVVA